MPYNLSENGEKQYVSVTHTDEMTSEELKLVQIELAARLMMRKWTKVYIDLQNAVFPPAFSLLSHFTLTESHKNILPPEVKIATVVNPEQKLHGDAVEKAGQLSEVNIKSFYSEEMAMEWLD